MIEKVRSHTSRGAESIAFSDMDGDGRDDLFLCGYKNSVADVRTNSCTCRLIDKKGIIETTLDQFNVPNLVISPEQVHFSDFDRDGNKEFWMLSAEDEQLFLYGFEQPEYQNSTYRFHLDSGRAYNGSHIMGYHLTHEMDLNRDGMNELIFSINNGFPIHPRRNYAIDIANNEILRSPSTSAGLFMNDFYSAPNGDIFFTGTCNTPGNHEDSIHLPYPDTSSFVFLFNDKLEFIFDPIPVCNYPSTNANFIQDGYLINVIRDKVDTKKLILQKRELQTGELMLTKELPMNYGVARENGNHILVIADKKLIAFDSDLKVKQSFESEFVLTNFYLDDLDNNGDNEIILPNVENQISYVLDSEMKVLTAIPESFRLNEVSVRKNTNEKSEFVSLTRDEVIYYTYSANPFYWFRFPYYLLVFGATSFITYFLFKTYRKNIENKFQKERELNRLQLLSLKNQIDPHFALNALNTIDWMYKQKEHEKASRFMETYSRLVHQTVKSSNQIAVNIFEELSFCRKFCELEKMRDPEFDYSVNVDEEVDTFEVEIPRQLIFTHVENAVKHGLRPKDGDKKLEIEVIKEGEDLCLIVENNGLTYQKKSRTSGTSKGLEIHQQLIDIYRDLKKVNISSEIGPCADGSGTYVKMLVKDLFRPTH